MAHLPYTDGSDGNGLRAFDKLLRRLRANPLDFYNRELVESYGALLTPAREARLLAVFDAEGSSAATLAKLRRRVDAATGAALPPPEVFNKMARFQLRVLCSEPPADENRKSSHIGFLLLQDAAKAGLTYTLCPGCTAADSVGHATTQLCKRQAVKQLVPGEGWHADNVVPVCCGMAQLLRDRTPDDSERFEQKFERAKAAMQADDHHDGYSGRSCKSPACSRREAFEGEFKRCGACGAVRYCCQACQARRLHAMSCAPRNEIRAAVRTCATAADAPPLLCRAAEGGLEAAQAHLRAEEGGVSVPCGHRFFARTAPRAPPLWWCDDNEPRPNALTRVTARHGASNGCTCGADAPRQGRQRTDDFSASILAFHCVHERSRLDG